MPARQHCRQQDNSQHATPHASSGRTHSDGNRPSRVRSTIPDRMTVIRPGVRQFLSEVIPLVLLGLLGIAVFPLAPKNTYVTYAYTALYALLLITLSTRYAVLRAYSWQISNVKICRRHGILTRQTDYIELYRVVDYREMQTFLQRLLGVKTVVIISTDKSEPSMPIHGVPAKADLVSYIRTLVEQNKKENHIYEITNR